MPPSPAQRRLPLLLVVALLFPFGTLVGGCAQFPRIDPTGERFLIWPGPTAASPAIGALSAIPTNQAAPPVFGSGGGTSLCPLCPLCPLGKCNCLGAPFARTTGRPALPEQLKITPERILAPIGSEVVLKAGVCADTGYLRTNRRIEWMLNPQGTGQFVTVGEQGEMDFMRAPWQRPNKFDNTYAVGYTSPFHTCVNRGTADPSDDTQIRPGEAWITVSSPTEGASFVTAHAPESNNWPARRASATIYWVDAQWQLPTSTSVQPGQSHTLTTTVTRQSDGSPLAGYVVRYEVLEGPTARLGYEAGQVSEVTTDAQGRASVLVSPTDDQQGMARVKTTVIRPVRSAPMPSPRLELGSGEAVVSWSPMATPPLTGPAPTLPNEGGQGGSQPPAPFEPPPRDTSPLPAAGLPQLEVVVTRDSSGPVAVGDLVPVTITVLNSGDAPATGILVRDAYDRGLTNANDISGDYEIKYNAMPDLAPGESDIVKLEFTAITAGRQCHRVTVTATGAEEAFEQQCIEVQRPAAQAAARLEAVVEGEIQREVGQLYHFRTRVFNRGSSVVEGATVEIWHESDAMLKPTQAWEGHTQVNRGFRWQLPTLQPGDSAPFEVEYQCLAPTTATKVSVFVEGPGIETITETRAVEIVPARGGPSLGGTAPGIGPTPTPGPASPLRGTLSSTANPAQVGRPALLNVLIENTGTTPLRDVEFRVIFPPQLQPTLTPGMTSLPFRVNQNALQFDPVRELRPGDSIRIPLPFEALSQGEVEVLLEMRSAGLDSVQSATTRFSVRSR